MKETAFELATSNIRYGAGATREIGMDLEDMKARRVLVVTDLNLRNLPPVNTVLETLDKHKIEYDIYDRARVEPTDESLQDAIEFAKAGSFDAFVAIGGGSAMDTAKAANLYSTYPVDDFLDYVNKPIGKGLPVPGRLKPLIAIPTTAGTGSETTGVIIFDLVAKHAKTGIADRGLKPTIGILDPHNTRTLSPLVTACTGLDILTHSIESYTTIPYTERPYPERPILRPAYQGANPISDIWAMQALQMAGKYLPRVAENPSDEEARGMMLLAASYGGMGFGNAGLHLPHGMSYPVSGMVRSYQPPDYKVDYPLVPHGMAVVLNAPAAFRFTGPGNPERHLQAAEALGANVSSVRKEDAGKILADQLIQLMLRLKIPNGLSAIGYTREDIPALVQGTLPQHRVTKLSPRPAGKEELTQIFEDALVYW